MVGLLPSDGCRGEGPFYLGGDCYGEGGKAGALSRFSFPLAELEEIGMASVRLRASRLRRSVEPVRNWLSRGPP
jgi:hypothetical protein